VAVDTPRLSKPFSQTDLAEAAVRATRGAAG